MAINLSSKEIKDDINVTQAVDLDVMEADNFLNNDHRASDGVVDHTGLEPRLRSRILASDLNSGDLIRINSLGEFAPALEKIASNIKLSETAIDEFENSTGAQHYYNPATGVILETMPSASSPYPVYVRAGIVSGDSISWGTTVDIAPGLTASNGMYYAMIGYDPNADQYIVSFRYNGDAGSYVTTISVSGNTITIEDGPTRVLYGGGGANFRTIYQILWHELEQKFVIAWADTSTSYLQAAELVGGVFSWVGSAVSLGASDDFTVKFNIDQSTGRILTIYNTAFKNIYIRAAKFTGGVLGVGSATLLKAGEPVITDGQSRNAWVVFNTNTNKFVALSNWNGANYASYDEVLYYSMVEVDDSLVITATPHTAVPVNLAEATGVPLAVFVPSQDALYMTHSISNNQITLQRLDVVGDTLVLDTDFSSTPLTGARFNSGPGYHEISYDPVLNRVMVSIIVNNYDNGVFFIEPSNLVKYFEDVAGILQENGLTGETKSAALQGHISTIHSGLTIGAIQYIQSDSSIDEIETNSPIGVAISDTEILIGDDHQLDVTRHTLQGDITITASQVSDFETTVSNNASVVQNTAHSADVTSNPHSLTVMQAWNTVEKTGTYTAVASDEILANTNTIGFTINLPAGPSPGDSVRIIDALGTFATNNLLVGRNGSNIRGVADDLNLDLNGSFVEFIYVNASIGWTYMYYV